MCCFTKKVLFAGIVLMPYLGLAQGNSTRTDSLKMTLPDIWDKAVLYNKRIRMQDLLLRTSEEEIKAAKAEKLPEINVAGEYGRVSNLPLYENGIFSKPEYFPVLHGFYSVGADASLNLYNGNQTNLRIKERETHRSIRNEQKNRTVSEVKLSAATYFLELQRSHIFRELIIRNIADQEKQLVQIRQLHANGVVLKSDILRAELQLSRQRLSLTQIENDIALACQKINVLTGQPDDAYIIPVTSPAADSATLKTYEDYLADASESAFQLRISGQESGLRKLQIKSANARILPKVGLFANYAYSYPQIRFYPYAAVLYGLGTAGVRVRLPVSALYTNKYGVKTAELELQRQELEHKDTEDAVRQQVKEAFLRYREALNRMDVAKSNILQATENHRIVNNTYFNQLSLLTDLLDANMQLLQTRFDLAAAEISAQMQFYHLKHITGKL